MLIFVIYCTFFSICSRFVIKLLSLEKIIKIKNSLLLSIEIVPVIKPTTKSQKVHYITNLNLKQTINNRQQKK